MYGIVTLALAVIVLPAIVSKSPITWADVLYAVAAIALVFVVEMGRNFFVAAADAVEAAEAAAADAVEAAEAMTATVTDHVAKLEKQLEPLLQQRRLRATAYETLSLLDSFLHALLRYELDAEGSINVDQWVAHLDDVFQPLRDTVPDELKEQFSACGHPYTSLADIRIEAENIKNSMIHLALRN
jgi:hypothetical protein